MNALPASPPADATVVLIAFCILLVPLAIAGISLINAGLGRSRSAAHSMAGSLCVLAVAAVVYFACGFALQGYPGRPAHILITAGKSWDWMAAERFFFRGLEWDGSPASFTAWLQMFSVGLAAVIPLSSGADRWRLSASCASSALLAAVSYPLFAHWTWGGGWLAQLGVNFGLGRGFLDAGGSSTIHGVGGLTALAIAWILGPRHGKYAADGMAAAIPGHNAVYVVFGCLLALPGWVALNGAGALLFTGMPAGHIGSIAINTTLSAAAAALTGAVMTRVRFGRPDASLTANGWVSGLVASSAGCAFLSPAAAFAVGLVAGAVVIPAIELFELRLKIDDPGGAIAVHGVAGIWGILSVGLLGRLPSGQWLAQVVGIATLLGFLLPLTYGLNWLLDRVHPQRVPMDGERVGMDLYELGAGAYPDFVTHSDEFIQK